MQLQGSRNFDSVKKRAFLASSLWQKGEDARRPLVAFPRFSDPFALFGISATDGFRPERDRVS